jgi:hypothetical protein
MSYDGSEIEITSWKCAEGGSRGRASLGRGDRRHRKSALGVGMGCYSVPEQGMCDEVGTGEMDRRIDGYQRLKCRGLEGMGDDRADQTDGAEDMNLAMWCKNKYCELGKPERVGTWVRKEIEY